MFIDTHVITFPVNSGVIISGEHCPALRLTWSFHYIFLTFEWLSGHITWSHDTLLSIDAGFPLCFVIGVTDKAPWNESQNGQQDAQTCE